MAGDGRSRLPLDVELSPSSVGARLKVTSSVLCECREGASDQELIETKHLAVEDPVG